MKSIFLVGFMGAGKTTVVSILSEKMNFDFIFIGQSVLKYQVPVEVSKNRRIALAMRWIIQYSKGRKGKTMADRLASELVAASNNEGSSIKKKEDTHKMAEANKAFAHFG